MKQELFTKPIINYEWDGFSLTPCLTFGVIDESNIDSEILDEDVHASKPNEITTLSNNMSKNIFSKHKKSNSALEVESNIVHIKNRDTRIYSQDSMNKTMSSVGTESYAKHCKKTLKIEVKELLQAVIAMNKKNTNDHLRYKSSSYSKNNKLLNAGNRIEPEWEIYENRDELNWNMWHHVKNISNWILK